MVVEKNPSTSAAYSAHIWFLPRLRSLASKLESGLGGKFFEGFLASIPYRLKRKKLVGGQVPTC